MLRRPPRPPRPPSPIPISSDHSSDYEDEEQVRMKQELMRDYKQQARMRDYNATLTPQKTIFSTDPSPIIPGKASVRYPNKDLDHLECFFNNSYTNTKSNPYISSDEMIELFNTNGNDYKKIDDIKYFDNNLFDKRSKKVVEYAKTKQNRLCEGLGTGYVTDSINQMQMLLCLVRRDPTKKGGRILGFATFGMKKYFGRGKLYIDVLCASLQLKGGGGQLINGIKKTAIQLGNNLIELKSVKTKDTVDFYIKKGFSFTKTKDTQCDTSNNFTLNHNDKLCTMILPIHDSESIHPTTPIILPIHLPAKSKSKSKKSKSESISNSVPEYEREKKRKRSNTPPNKTKKRRSERIRNRTLHHRY